MTDDLVNAAREALDVKIDAHVIALEKLMKQGVRKSFVLLGMAAMLCLLSIAAMGATLSGLMIMPPVCYIEAPQ